jgi:signal transduction histidine kinase
LSDNKLQIRLVDDGKGFDTITTHQGNGLKNMKTRALRLEATLDVLSAPDKGTQIILNLPEIK